MRIAVIGTSGAGKSTLAKKIAEIHKINYIEQDNLFWDSNWRPKSKDSFKAELISQISKDSWSICGNHSMLQELIWQKATHVIWLNYSMKRCLFQGFKRSLRRVFLKEPCCNNNIETFKHAFLSKNSILWWIYKTYDHRVKSYSDAIRDDKFKNLEFIEFKNPKEVKLWLVDFYKN